MTQSNRAGIQPTELIDRSQRLEFMFDGRRYSGFEGDTLASALIANGVNAVGRSLKYRRPRGIFGSGPEEPNALLTVLYEGNRVPNVKATEVLLREGLLARSQRGWPSARWDIGAAVGLVARLLPPGFYYKTFLAPRRFWPLFERILRHFAAGGDPGNPIVEIRHEKRHVHCDVLVVGTGPAGLAAALVAARSGARVVVADESPQGGGSLLDFSEGSVAGINPNEWAKAAIAELAPLPNVEIYLKTVVFGRYPHGRYGAVQTRRNGQEVFLHIQARSVVLASGALERGIIFSNNDRPGIMLASAAMRYARRYAAKPGREAVIFTNNDTGYTAADALRAVGVEVKAIVDTRGDAQDRVCEHRVLGGAAVISARGRRRIRGIEVQTQSGREAIDCDLLCVAGGWTPTVHLLSHGPHQGLRFDEQWGSFVPANSRNGEIVVSGAAAGVYGLQELLDDGLRAGRVALELAGLSLPTVSHRIAVSSSPMYDVNVDDSAIPLHGKAFVDLQTDVDVHDIEIAIAEGYTSVEHVKRYTTLGMGTDQGKTGNVNAVTLIAQMTSASPQSVGTTTYRPPYTPVTIGALAGDESGERLAARRRTPMDPWHRKNGAVFQPAGLWDRPRHFGPVPEDTDDDVSLCEAKAVRTGVGIADVSTLGKLELRGGDVATFLDKIYTNSWSSLAVGRVRYGLMLRDDGCVLDDGTTTRTGADTYLMTTSTGHAEAIMEHIRFYHECIWPKLDLQVTAVTEQFASIALAGPQSRRVLEQIIDPEAISNSSLPFMSARWFVLGDLAVWIARISFSGELGYELSVPANYGLALWNVLLEEGRRFGIRPYGVKAMDYLRIEKGHVVTGREIDGRTAPGDLGLERLCSANKDFIGRFSLEKAGFADQGRLKLAGFIATGQRDIPPGSQLVLDMPSRKRQDSVGRITSTGVRVSDGRPLALGLIRGGAALYEGPIYAWSPSADSYVEVLVIEPRMYDPEGARMRT